MEGVQQVVTVLADQALFGVETEGHCHRFEGLGGQGIGLGAKSRRRRVTRHQARQEEVECDRHPRRDELETEPLEGEPHGNDALTERSSSPTQPAGQAFPWQPRSEPVLPLCFGSAILATPRVVIGVATPVPTSGHCASHRLTGVATHTLIQLLLMMSGGCGAPPAHPRACSRSSPWRTGPRGWATP